MVENRFDNIKIVITNNKEEIKPDFIKNRKSIILDISNSLVLLLSLKNVDIKYNKKFLLFDL